MHSVKCSRKLDIATALVEMFINTASNKDHTQACCVLRIAPHLIKFNILAEDVFHKFTIDAANEDRYYEISSNPVGNLKVMTPYVRMYLSLHNSSTSTA